MPSFSWKTMVDIRYTGNRLHQTAEQHSEGEGQRYRRSAGLVEPWEDTKGTLGCLVEARSEGGAKDSWSLHFSSLCTRSMPLMLWVMLRFVFVNPTEARVI